MTFCLIATSDLCPEKSYYMTILLSKSITYFYSLRDMQHESTLHLVEQYVCVEEMFKKMRIYEVIHTTFCFLCKYFHVYFA